MPRNPDKYTVRMPDGAIRYYAQKSGSPIIYMVTEMADQGVLRSRTIGWRHCTMSGLLEHDVGLPAWSWYSRGWWEHINPCDYTADAPDGPEAAQESLEGRYRADAAYKSVNRRARDARHPPEGYYRAEAVYERGLTIVWDGRCPSPEYAALSLGLLLGQLGIHSQRIISLEVREGEEGD